jgi:putative SOS response-associated peptidase YedK
VNALAPTAYKTGPAIRAGEYGAVIRRDRSGGVELTNLRWGLRPPARRGRPLLYLRSEEAGLAGGRCLLPASEFFGTHRGWRYRVSRVDGDFFYFAGIWRPAGNGWPQAYAILTIPAAPDLALYMTRQMAALPRAKRYAWLDLATPAAEVLRPLPPGTFRIEAAGEADLFG